MLIITAGIIVNILSIIALLIGLFHKFENPKRKAIFGYIVVTSIIMYILLLSIIAIYGLFENQNLYSTILFLCVISPFVIGKLVNYNSLRIYTIIQILCFLLSLTILIIWL